MLPRGEDIPIEEYLSDGFQCFAGKSPPLGKYQSSDSDHLMDCGINWLWALLYTMLNLWGTVTAVYVIRYAGAAFVVIARCSVLVISAFLSMSDTLMGETSETVTLSMWLSIVGLTFAISVFSFGSVHDKEKKRPVLVGAQVRRGCDVINAPLTQSLLYRYLTVSHMENIRTPKHKTSIKPT